MSGVHHNLRYLPHPERSRYIPQYDEEILGHGAFQRDDYYNNPPDPVTLDVSRYHYCGACQTTWLVGFEGDASANVHPSHNTLLHRNSGQSRRSMVVHAPGVCPDGDAALGKSSAGIFFGPGSLHNVQNILPTFSLTKQTAEILAAADALYYVRKTVKPRREEIVLPTEGILSEHHWQDGSNWTTSRLERHRNNLIFRLIIVTDSSYLVECLCRYKQAWRLKPNSVDLRDYNGAPLPDGPLLVRLLEEINELSRDGVDVV